MSSGFTTNSTPAPNLSPIAPEVRVLGIRHHGPGSAKSVVRALKEMQPDAILVEGPSDANDILPVIAHPELQPPVALLVYVPDEPKRSVFYPFAVFSPEYQAIRYGITNNITVNFMDLPACHQLAQKEENITDSEPGSPLPVTKQDPMAYLAEAAGYSDSERWWEHMVEHRRDSTDLFSAILEAMSELRSSLPVEMNPLEAQREAWMRQCIRSAQSQGHKRIAVVCGAWHAPALAELPSANKDAEILKGLPKVKTQATLVPWTYRRLSYFSGYGAGIESPGWYDHLWTTDDNIAINWMTRVAHLLREEDLDASSAHIIEAVRLAECLAALRECSLPGLDEMNEAAKTVFCFGSDVPMRLIAEKLIISDRMGKVPEDIPTVPLQQDLLREQKRLRMPAEPTQKTMDLDLRKPNDLDRSHLLHRMSLLGIDWGIPTEVSGKKGTFHEVWIVQWQPEFSVSLIEAARWGNTVYDAASSYARNLADKANDLPSLARILDKALLADIPEAVHHLMARIEAESAVASDIFHLMDALPPLVNIIRYGNVRQTDTQMVKRVADGLIVRICIGLPGACSSLDDEAAHEMFNRLIATNSAVVLLNDEDHLESWKQVLLKLADQNNLNGLIAGRCCRILLDAGKFDAEEAACRLGLALSRAVEPSQAAAWVEGFLVGSGLLLLHTDIIWQVLDEWVMSLPRDSFTELLPILKRTFSTFPAPERRQMGERIKRGLSPSTQTTPTDTRLDHTQAEAVLPIIARLLGIGGE